MGYKDFDLRVAHLEAAKVSGKGDDVLCTVIIWPNNPKRALMGPSLTASGAERWVGLCSYCEGIKSPNPSPPGFWGCVTAHGPLLLRNLSCTSFPCRHCRGMVCRG